MEMNKEIRKIPSNHRSELARRLEFQQSWKRLMVIIPKTLQKNNYECDSSPLKYHSEHFKMIEDAALRSMGGHTCSEILLDEWGTSGQVRPTLGHLLHLLKKAELYREADYVATEILKVDAPDRPAEGPAARVTLNEMDLNHIHYNTSDLERGTIENNLNRNTGKSTMIIPKIIITEPTQNHHRFIVQRVPSTHAEEVSDMIEFSQDSKDIPAFSQILSKENSDVIPDFSQLQSQNSSSVISSSDDISTKSQSSENISRSTEVIPQFSALMESSSNNVPILSALMKTNSTNSSRKSCASPLPNISFNTSLPHFNYDDLEKATNNFDTTPHKTSMEIENSLDDSNGRFLGSGAYGSVYLALGLLDKPIAVKKLHLSENEIVDFNSKITRPFRNEVEGMSRYKHPNLLSLCGYSCDGPAYCVMYEYISGGALNYRLEKFRNKLKWKDRLNIALGTAEAVAYLHTLFEKPLIHRDIKTANILLDCSNQPKLGDFGISKLISNGNSTMTTTIVGTTVYMADEIFRSGEISVKTDTYSFGVVLLELLTALPAFDENRENRDLVSHVEYMCNDDDTICPLLDKSAGLWVNDQIDGTVDVAERLYKLASKCLAEKRKRPTMVDVRDFLRKLV